MFSTIKRWFGYGGDAPASAASTTQQQGRRKDFTQLELTHDAAIEELEQVRAQLLTAKIQVEQVVTRLARVAEEQQVLYAKREEVLMECHDGYLHPQLDGLSAPVAPMSDDDEEEDEEEEDDIEASAFDERAKADPETTVRVTNDSSSAFHLPASPGVAAPAVSTSEATAAAAPAVTLSEKLQRLRQKRAIRMARSQRLAQLDDGIIPCPASAEQPREVILATFKMIASRREAIGASFERIMNTLERNRETLDSSVLRLETELLRLEADERYLAQAVREMDRAEWRDEMADEASQQRREAREARRRLVNVAGQSYTTGGADDTTSSDDDGEDEDVCAIEIKGSPLVGVATGASPPVRQSVQPVPETPLLVVEERRRRKDEKAEAAATAAVRKRLNVDDEREMSDREALTSSDDDDEALAREVERLRRSGDKAPPLSRVVSA